MKFLVLVASLFICNLAISQNKAQPQTDSLLTKLKTVSGSPRAEVLMALSRLALPSHLDSAVKMINEAVAIYCAKKNDTAVFVLYLNFAKILRQKGKGDLGLHYAYKAKSLKRDQLSTHHFQLLLYNELAGMHY